MPFSPWDPPANTEDVNQALVQELEARYGSKRARDVLPLYADDLGIGKYNIKVTPTKNLLAERRAWGQHLPDHGQLLYQANVQDPYHETATLAHEMAHVADDVLQSSYSGNSKVSSSHHTGMPGEYEFEPHMAQSLAAQQLIELGFPLAASAYKDSPWLREVKPLSSNRLASPWSNAKTDLSSEIHNGTRLPVIPAKK